MIKILLSRFSESPAFVSSQNQQFFEGCLTALADHERAQEIMSETMAADDFWFASDDWRSQFRPYTVKDGILQIPVKGVLLHDFPWQLGSWATGYAYIWKAFERGLADPEVKGIALLEHSPGGEVAGNFDLVDRMYARRGEKPVRAFAHEYAYSAAYSIASVADHIVVSRTGGVGSIGVVTSHVDMSKMLDNMGWKITFISAPEDGHKVDGNPYEPLKPEVKARMQKRINALYDVFVETVSRNRSMDEKAVRDTKALTFSADEAVSIGLADSVGPLDDALAAFAADLTQTNGGGQMSDKTDHAAVLEAARVEAHKAGVAEGKADGLAEGAKAERERVNAIIGADEAKDRPKAALSAALKTDMTVAQAKAFLADLPSEKVEASAETEKADVNAQRFDEAMGDTPGVGSDEAERAEEEDSINLAKKFGLAGY